MVRLKDVDIPISALQERNPKIDRFSAGFIILSRVPRDHLSKLFALLIQRGCDCSFGKTLEGPGGGLESRKDVTIISTALRETKEETNIEVPQNATFPVLYSTELWHINSRMGYYTFVTERPAKIPVTLSEERLCSGFFDADDVQDFETFDKEKSITKRNVMLES
ncbi:hypothetical protein N7523_010208 [Penicillium sp. IBT 18751x]|nr:hypothetical protein N7523_010208 [Penicillium sp. IBT 18751x]